VNRSRNAMRAWMGAIALACLVAAPCRAQSVMVAQGPMIGAITAKSAAVWFRLTAPAVVRVRWRGQNAVNYTYSDPVAVAPESDDTGRVAIPGLMAGKTYTYQVGITGPEGVETWSGSYTFATIPGTVNQVSFAVLSDFSNKLKGSAALRSALASRPDFVAVVGDLDHRNPASDSKQGLYPPEEAPRVLADMRSMHRDTRDFATAIGNDFASGLIGRPGSGQLQIPLYYGWDDHDFCTNNAGTDCPFAAQAVQAYREYYLWSADNGIDGTTSGCPQASSFQRVDYGRVLSLFILDARSAHAKGSDSMLGGCQYAWLTQGLLASKATWKVVVTPVPFNPATKPWDGWGSVPAERANLLSFIRQKDIRNLLFLSGDVHSGGAVDEGEHSGVPEISVPHANMPDDWINTYCETFDHKAGARSQPGLWSIGTLVEPDFDTTGSPTCAGDALAAGVNLVYPVPGVYASSGKGHPGYVRVDATTTTLRAMVIGADGLTRYGTRADGSLVPMGLQFTVQ
jgi:alkaline phosphatase D